MKTAYIILLCTLVTLATFAQRNEPLRNDKNKIIRSLFKKFEQNQLLLNENKKLRALDDRLIAEVYDENGDIDSTTYSYTGTRGSKLEAPFYLNFVEDIDFDTKTGYYPMNTPINKTTKIYVNNLVVTKIDSSYSGMWVPEMKSSYTYDANNKVTEEIIETWKVTNWENAYKNAFTYNAGNMISNLYLTWNGTGWDSFYRTSYTYTGANKTSEIVEFYTGANWENTYKMIYTYNGNNQLTSELYQMWSGATWENEDRYTYIYSVSNKLDSLIYQGWDGTQWENVELYRLTWTNNRITLIYTDTWDGTQWEKYSKQTQTYNNKEYPTNFISETWDGTNYVFDPNNDYKIRYYYQEYNNGGVAVNDVEDVSKIVTLYPNPAYDILNIQMKDNNIAIENVKIANIKGETLFEQRIINNGSLIQIPIKELPSGLYLLNLSGENKSFKAIQFVKQ